LHGSKPLPASLSEDFHNQVPHSFDPLPAAHFENQGRLRKTRLQLPRTAPGTRQMAVDDLHSIDFPADKTPRFLLTLKMKGVKTNSFFDSF
jgi:hypothetical protein